MTGQKHSFFSVVFHVSLKTIKARLVLSYLATFPCFPPQDPVLKIPFSNVYQHVCTYRAVHYKTFELPDCPPGVNPVVTYPVALSCHCGRCTMDTSDCTFESLHPNFCMNDIPFYY